MIYLGIRIDKEIKEKLEKKAKEEERSISQVVRIIIKEFFNKKVGKNENN